MNIIQNLNKIKYKNNDFIYDIFLRDNNVIIVGNNIYTEKLNLDDIKIYNANNEIISNFTTSQENGDGFFVKVFKLSYHCDEIVIDFLFNEINKKFKLTNYDKLLNKFNLDTCISTLFKNDFKEFYNWYKYYSSLGVTTFLIYLNGDINLLDNEFLEFIKEKDNIILFEWNFSYAYFLNYDELDDFYKKYFTEGTIRIANAQLQSLNHCLYLIKEKCKYLLICDFDEFLNVDNLNTITKTIINVPGYYFPNIFSKYIENKVMVYKHNELRNYKYIVQPKLVSELHVHGFLQLQLCFSKLLNKNFFFCHLINKNPNRCNAQFNEVLKILDGSNYKNLF